MTSAEFWQAEVERLEKKFAQSGDVCDKLQAEASRIMLDPTHAGGFEMALDHAIFMASDPNDEFVAWCESVEANA